jgi:sulfur-oxidizing protein SoxY
MDVSRRQFVGTGLVAAAAFFGLPRIATAQDLDAAINAFTGGAVADDGITLIAPEIAENGNTVPIEVDAPGAEAIMVLAAGNPNPGRMHLQLRSALGSSGRVHADPPGRRAERHRHRAHARRIVQIRHARMCA